MSKKTSKKSAPKDRRWSLGVFKSAADGNLIAVYCTTSGRVSPSYGKSVTSKQALFHNVYSGVTYSQARASLIADAAKAGVKESKASTKQHAAKAAKEEHPRLKAA